MKKQRIKKGFTLIELSLALAFIGVLSITIVLIINNTVQAYRRGLTLNEINTVGMELVDDMRVAVQNSPAKLDECEGGGCTVFDEGSGDGAYGGFCTGRYSYVWTKDASVTVNGKGGFYFAKVRDDDRKICEDGNTGKSDSFTTNGNEAPEVLLARDDNDLRLYSLGVSGPVVDEAGGTAFYIVDFVLGTKDGVDVNATSCTPPKEANSKFDYCAINKFSFAAQAGGKSNEAN